MKRFFSKLTFIYSITSTFYLFAQNQLNEVVVTAHKFDQKLKNSSRSVIVINDSLLKRYQGHTVAEILQKQAGFTVVGSNGPLGSNQEMYYRGAAFGKTLVLIDGVPMFDPSYISSGFDLNLLNSSLIDKIEILSGSQASLYGSNASAGVIQIFTKKYKNKEKLNGNVTLQRGTLNTTIANIGLYGRVSKLNYTIQLASERSEGFSAVNGNLASTLFDKDGYKSDAARFELDFPLGKYQNLKLYHHLKNYRSELDAGPFTDDRDYTSKQGNTISGMHIKGKKGTFDWNLISNFSQNDRNFVDDSTFVPKNAFNTYAKSTFEASSFFSDLYLNKKLSENINLIWGVDYRTNAIEQTYVSYSAFGKYEDTPISNDSANINQISSYLSANYTNSNFNFEIGGRINKHSIYGVNSTYNLGLSYWLASHFKTFINVNSGYNVPSLYQLYSVYGNKQLKPETTTNAELGIRFTKNTFDFSASYFNRKAKDVYFFSSLPTFPFGQYINFDRQQDSGIELSLSLSQKKWGFHTNYSYLTGKINTEVAGKDTTFNNLFRRPRHQINLGGSVQLTKKLSLISENRVAGQRTDRFFNETTFAAENKELKAYFVADIMLNYQINQNLRINFDLRNITNSVYEEAYGYSTRPRFAMIGFSLQP